MARFSSTVPGTGGSGGAVDLSPYALKSQLPDLSTYALKSQLADLTPYATKAQLASYVPVDIATGESTFPRASTDATAPALTGGVMKLAFFTAAKSETVTQVRTITGGTAQVAATLNRIGVFTVDASGNLTLVASTVSDATLWSAATTRYTKALSASFSKVAGQRYAVGFLSVGATTQTTLVGKTTSIGMQNENFEPPMVSAQYAGGSDLPATVAVGSLASTLGRVYAVLLP